MSTRTLALTIVALVFAAISCAAFALAGVSS